MAGKAKAVFAGNELRDAVCAKGTALGLKVTKELYVGRRIWGAKRRIDIVLTDPSTRVSLGIECKYQGTRGNAEEKIPSTIEDIKVWPIRGLVVYAGEGFTQNMESYLVSTGMAVHLDDLDAWLKLYFGL
jgi:hypothetical protein